MVRRDKMSGIFKVTIIVLIALTFLLVIGYSIVAPQGSKFLYTTKVIRNVANTLTIIFIITVIILENKSPIKALAWMLALISIPVGGIFLYLFFGRNYHKRKMYNLKELTDNKEILALYESELHISDAGMKYLTEPFQVLTAKLLFNNSKAFLSTDNKVEVYKDGVETFKSIFEQLEKAKYHIHLEYFAVGHDGIGNTLKKVLIQKASEGVKVRFIIDYVGSLRLKKSYRKELKDAGVELVEFAPTVFQFVNSSLNYRNHRKIIVIDGEVGFVGGLNIGDSYVGKNKHFGYWRDSHLMLHGEAVKSLQAIFLTDWNFVTGELLLEMEYFPPTSIVNYNPMQIVASGPDADWSSIMQVYFSMIAGARHSIQISSPYLVLDESLQMGIKTAALSGVDVKIIIPGMADHQIVYWGTQSYIEDLLEAGVKIYRYTQGFIHAKVLVADGVCASVGTANMDIRSFNHNFEVNALLYGEETIKTLMTQFEQDLKDSEEIILEEFKKRGTIVRMRESICRLFSPLL
ncbi:MAG: cardiolipin synthase [Candidatus Zophobacter franzmannii]|nr:cardiolipin synthase [Candidatus Zophobacter franzmannii]